MTRFVLCLLLAGCSHAATPVATPANPAPTAPPTPAVAAPDVLVWTTYQDFQGHGFKGEGRGYRNDGGAWLVAECYVSHVADPAAGPQAGVQCGAWSAVAAGQGATLDALPRHGVDLTCHDRPDTCAALGLHEQPIR